MPGIQEKIVNYRFFDVIDFENTLSSAGVFITTGSNYANNNIKASIAIYLLAEEGMSVRDIQNLDKLPEEKTREIGKRYIAAMKAHPVIFFEDTPEAIHDAEMNVAWHGEMMARAISKIKAEGLTFPGSADMKDPEKRNELLEGGFGLLHLISLTHDRRMDAMTAVGG